MKLAVVFGARSADIRNRLLAVQDSLVIDAFMSIPDLISTSETRAYFYDRILVLSSALRATGVDSTIQSLYTYWKAYTQRTQIVLLCKAGAEDDLARAFSSAFASSQVTSMSVTSTSVKTIAEAACGDVREINQKYGVKIDLSADLDEEVLSIEEPSTPSSEESMNTESKGYPMQDSQQEVQSEQPVSQEAPVDTSGKKSGFFKRMFGGKNKKTDATAPNMMAQEQMSTAQQMNMPEQNAQMYDQNGQMYDQNGQMYDQNAQAYDQNAQAYDQNAQAYDQNAQAYGVSDTMYSQSEQSYVQNGQMYDQNMQGSVPSYEQDGQYYTEQGSTAQPEYGRVFESDVLIHQTSDDCGDADIASAQSDFGMGQFENNIDSSTETQGYGAENFVFDAENTENPEISENFNTDFNSMSSATEYSAVQDDATRSEYAGFASNSPEAINSTYEGSADNSIVDDALVSVEYENSEFSSVDSSSDGMQNMGANFADYDSELASSATSEPSFDEGNFSEPVQNTTYQNYNVNTSNMQTQHQVEVGSDTRNFAQQEYNLGYQATQSSANTRPSANSWQGFNPAGANNASVVEDEDDFGNMSVGDLEDTYRQHVEQPQVKIVEKEVIKEVVKEVKVGGSGSSSVYGSVLRGRTKKVILVTGDRGSGVTSLAYDIALWFSKYVPTLYFDGDVELHGLLSYIEYDQFCNYDASQQQGVKLCRSAKAFPSCVMRYDTNLDILTSNYGVEISDDELELTQSVVAEIANNYGIVVVDAPIDKLQCFTDLILSGNVCLCVEANKRGFMNAICKLENSALPVRYKRNISGTGTMVYTKVNPKINMKKLVKYVSSIVEFEDVNWLGMQTVKREAKLNQKFLEEVLEG